jgi:hypothetical protein
VGSIVGIHLVVATIALKTNLRGNPTLGFPVVAVAVVDLPAPITKTSISSLNKVPQPLYLSI